MYVAELWASTCLDGTLNVDTAHVDANIASHLDGVSFKNQHITLSIYIIVIVQVMNKLRVALKMSLNDS